MPGSYTEYRRSVEEDVQHCLSEAKCQPILFVGSGLSKRYFGAPNWEELLEQMAAQCPVVKREYAYLKQTFGCPTKIGSYLVEQYKEWAWADGRSEFPKPLFSASQKPDIYLKHKVCEAFRSVTPASVKSIKSPPLRAELEALQAVQPHAIITTNYDTFLEVLFPKYEPIVGQQILRTNYVSIGEIFKIHGCAQQPPGLVLTEEDYAEFLVRKKYLSAKLLTYFAEHPLLFVGYSATDSNVRAILADIDEILAAEGELVPNLFFLSWDPNAEQNPAPQNERIISVSEERTVRLRNIVASSFDWVFGSFTAAQSMEKVNPKLLRALLARNFQLVRHDIPRKAVDVNFDTLEHAVSTEGQLAKLLGISTLDDPTVFNAAYPYTLSQVGESLGFRGWHRASQLLSRIKEDTGFDIKSCDNTYHIRVKFGRTAATGKYSQAAINLLEKVRDGKPYEVEKAPVSGPEVVADA